MINLLNPSPDNNNNYEVWISNTPKDEKWMLIGRAPVRIDALNESIQGLKYYLITLELLAKYSSSTLSFDENT